MSLYFSKIDLFLANQSAHKEQGVSEVQGGSHSRRVRFSPKNLLSRPRPGNLPPPSACGGRSRQPLGVGDARKSWRLRPSHAKGGFALAFPMGFPREEPLGRDRGKASGQRRSGQIGICRERPPQADWTLAFPDVGQERRFLGECRWCTVSRTRASKTGLLHTRRFTDPLP